MVPPRSVPANRTILVAFAARSPVLRTADPRPRTAPRPFSCSSNQPRGTVHLWQFIAAPALPPGPPSRRQATGHVPGDGSATRPPARPGRPRSYWGRSAAIEDRRGPPLSQRVRRGPEQTSTPGGRTCRTQTFIWPPHLTRTATEGWSGATRSSGHSGTTRRTNRSGRAFSPASSRSTASRPIRAGSRAARWDAVPSSSWKGNGRQSACLLLVDASALDRLPFLDRLRALLPGSHQDLMLCPAHSTNVEVAGLSLGGPSGTASSRSDRPARAECQWRDRPLREGVA